MSDDKSLQSRRNALKCTAYGGAGTLFALFDHTRRTQMLLTAVGMMTLGGIHQAWLDLVVPGTRVHGTCG